MKKANRLEFYHELFELIVRDPTIMPKGIAQYFDHSGRGRAHSTLLKHLQNMYEKQISFPPKLKLKSHENFLPTGFICHKENMRNTYATFRKLEKNRDIWYINMLSGADFFIVSKNPFLNLEGYGLTVHMRSPFFKSVYTLPQGWDKKESDIFDSFSNYDFRKGVLERISFGDLKWSELDWQIFNLARNNIRMKVSEIARKTEASYKTVKEHLWKHVVPECSIAHFFFPKGYDNYRYMYLRINSDFETSLIESFRLLPCTTYIFLFEEEINAVLFYESHKRILDLLEKLKEIGILNDYLLYIPIVYEGE